MATETEQLVVSLEARLRDFERNFQRAGQVSDRSFTQIERRARQSADRLESSFASSAGNLNRILGTIGAGVSFAEITRFADAWTEAGNKVRAAAAATSVQVRSLQELKRGANDARVSLEDYTDLYSRMVRSAAGVAKTEGDIARATSITAKAFKAGGASASEQAAGILQLGQALGSGVLQGDELRSLRENAPILAKAIADAFGVPVAALKRLGEQGKLTSEKVFNAILAAGPEVERQFKATNATIGDSFTALKNEFTAYIGTMAQSSGAAAAFRSVVDGLAGNIGSVTNAAAAAAAVLLTGYVPAMVRAGIAGAAMIATNPFALMATAAGAAVFAVSAFGDQIQPISGDLANLQDYAATAWGAIRDGASVAATTIHSAFQTVIDFTANALSGVGLSWADVGSVIKGVANVLVNSFTVAYDVLVATFGKLPAAIAETVLNAVNGLISTVEAGLNTVIAGVNAAVSAINSVGSKVGVELGKISAIDLGRIENSYAGAGEAAGNAYADALMGITRDRVGQALAGINGASDSALKEWRRRAEQHAGQRRSDQAAAQSSADAAKSAPITGAAKTMPIEMTKEYDDVQKRIAALQAEVALRKSVVGSVEEVEAALERQKIAQNLVNEAIKEGVVMTDDVKSKIGALADAYSKASQEAKALAKSQEEASQKAKDFEDTSKGALKGFISDLKAGKSPAEALSNAIGKITDKLFDMAIDQAWKGIFGNDPSKNIFGSITNTLFPSKPETVTAPGSALQGVNFDPNKTTGTMSVTAGTVTVNGTNTAIPGVTDAKSGSATTSEAKSVTDQAKTAGLPDPFAGKETVKGILPRNITDFGPNHFGMGTEAVPALRGTIDASSTAAAGSLNGLNPGQLRAALMQRTMNDFGLTKEQAAGVVGNLSQETGGFRQMQELKPLVPGSRGGYGMAQWTGSRRKEFEAFAAQQGKPTNDLDTQYAFLKKELDGKTGAWSKGSNLAGLKGTGSVEDSTLYFRENFERPGIPHDDARLRHANMAMQDFDNPTNLRPPGLIPNASGADQAAQQAQEQALQAQLEAQRRLQEQMQQATQATTNLTQPLQGIGSAATSVVPNLSGMTQGLTGLIGPLTQAVPGLGQFGGAISGLVQQLMSGIGGGAGLFGGIGKLFGFADGGFVSGGGTSTSDSIPAMLSNGEFVVNAKSTKRYGHLLDAINTGRAPAFAAGGFVGASNFTGNNTYAPSLNISVGGNVPGGNRLAQQIAAETSKALDGSRPDRFRKSEGQQLADAHARMSRMAYRNN